ncbi:hypothetical protein CNX70_18495 [Janthinobacterium svalbardensis]|uniref:Glycine zipper 2TM domain-containing protein n=1 Tax=Janthinobacterium svalbardensis TaxID=368607 RepID=A0A290WYE5_9BURK|nr:glycine zipper 2TM domain-containing protein [Janthinobacterium svalbardensis]ATD61929.1 hypothetical protein CNX70_18495 [Janthinobacterium svalbardensis]
METTTTSNRIHPLMAAAAVSLTLVSLVGAAAIAGILPNSHSAAVTSPTAEQMSSSSAPLAQQSVPAPVVREIVRYKTVVHHEYPRRHQSTRDSDHAQLAQADQSRDYRQTTAYQQPAPVAQNSPLGIGIGALVGGLVGSHVGGGNGRTLAAIAGAVGGGYVGNEIAKRNQFVGQQ